MAVPHSSNLVDRIVTQLQDSVLDGSLRPGEALPPERVLSHDLGVSRASLRQALSILQSRKVIQSRQGGGNYVCDVAQAHFVDPLFELLMEHKERRVQVLELRSVLDRFAAQSAAKRATESDRKRILQKLAELEIAMDADGSADLPTPGECAKFDLELHLCIADAAHNAPLSLMIRSIYSLLLEDVEQNLTRVHQDAAKQDQLLDQHRKLVDAICQGRPDLAGELSDGHFSLVEGL